MPTKPEADAGTPDKGADAGNIEPNPIADLDAALELAHEQSAVLEAQQVAIAELKAEIAKLQPKERRNDRTPSLPAPPPEGSKRYRSMGGEPLYIKDPGGRIIVDGTVVQRPQTGADFSGHVYETSDPDMIAWLDNHSENGVSFWEDPTAVRRHTTVEVHEGVKSTADTPRNPLAAPMQR